MDTVLFWPRIVSSSNVVAAAVAVVAAVAAGVGTYTWYIGFAAVTAMFAATFSFLQCFVFCLSCFLFCSRGAPLLYPLCAIMCSCPSSAAPATNLHKIASINLTTSNTSLKKQRLVNNLAPLYSSVIQQ